jgi:hypothetical protein
MAKEIKKETDWLGREKDVIYEGGTKVGETRHETTFWGNPIDKTYDAHGNSVSETRHETSLFGTSKEVTYDTHGSKVSETKYEEGIFGGKKGVIYDTHGNKIGELKTEKGFFGGRKQVLHESGEDVDLTRRVTREKPTKTEESSYSGSYSGLSSGRNGENVNLETAERHHEDAVEKEINKLAGWSRGTLQISKYTSPKWIKRMIDSNEIWLYSRIEFLPTNYLLTYRCTRCGHEWNEIEPDYNLNTLNLRLKSANCRIGCSTGADQPSLLGLYKIIKGLITGKEPFGYGILIKSEEL